MARSMSRYNSINIILLAVAVVVVVWAVVVWIALVQNFSNHPSPSLFHSQSQSHSDFSSQNLAWCPNAACSNSALCQPCRQRFLFILSTGRAASTALLDMINRLPNVRVGGENNNTLYIASKLETNLEMLGFAGLRSKVPARPHFSAWFHHEIPEQAMACTIQKVLQTINPPPEEIQQQIINSDSSERSAIALDRYETSQILGAKMIRVQRGNWTALQASNL
eukprot:scaffold6237_cov108-Skeletonema_marinoi.AAC.2